MALGDLSPDQQRYAGAVSAGTGLDPTVVRAWIGLESGWGVTRAGHNYLNIGPGRTYASTDQAAAAVVSLINTSRYYSAIRAAIPQGAVAQVEAIQASPWDAGHYAGGRLMKVYKALAGTGVVDAQLAGVGIPDWAKKLPWPFGAAAGALDWASDPIGKALAGALSIAVPAALGIVFTLGAFGLIAMGLVRLTGRDPRQVVGAVTGVAGTATTAAKLAAV